MRVSVTALHAYAALIAAVGSALAAVALALAAYRRGRTAGYAAGFRDGFLRGATDVDKRRDYTRYRAEYEPDDRHHQAHQDDAP